MVAPSLHELLGLDPFIVPVVLLSHQNNITSVCSTNHLKAEETKKAEMMRHFRKHFQSHHRRHLPALG
jgi:hypothetical protein